MRIQQSGWEMKRELERIPWCSAILTAVNVIVFLACQFYGNILYAEGSFSILYLIRNGEYYRLVTAMFMHADISHLANNMILLYFGGMIVATLLEYFTAVLMEAIFHTSWWDYSDQKFNFQGRIALNPSIRFGIGGMVILYLLQPLFEKGMKLGRAQSQLI